MTKNKKYILVLVAGLLLSLVAFLVWISIQSETGKNQTILANVKEYSFAAAKRDRATRLGEFKKDPSATMYGNGETLERIVKAKMYLASLTGKSVEPLVWSAHEVKDDIYLVTALFVDLDSLGKPFDCSGEFFEYRTIQGQYSVRWLSLEKDTTGLYRDFLAREYASDIQKIKLEYLRGWTR